ncbi:MAG: C10 family peptidase [Prevotella sp.]|nr:C10 family peptidase [Prevotella sp.]
MKYLLVILICCLPKVLCGESLDKETIMQIASEYLQTNRCAVVMESEAYSIIQRDDTTGFVIISLCGKHEGKVIGYSEEGKWDMDNIPPTLKNWLCQLDSYNEQHQPESHASKPAFRQNTLAPQQQKQSVSPLLTCHWHQNSPYNDLTPVITDGNVKTAAGCVAIAAAQITYYWRNSNPEYTLKDTPVYPYGAAPVTMSIPKGTPNNWNLIKDFYTSGDSEESRYAVAQLCYVIGTTSYLNYASSTGGQINDAANAMYSQYHLLSEYAIKSKYTQSEWEELIYQDISNGMPIMCAGSDGDGHAFVLDGYDAQKDLYHFNFGWGGSGDGYYPVDDSELSMGGYSSNQSIVYNIHPESSDTGIIQIQTTINHYDEETKVYNLHGQRVNSCENGIYIIDNRKNRIKVVKRK